MHIYLLCGSYLVRFERFLLHLFLKSNLTVEILLRQRPVMDAHTGKNRIENQQTKARYLTSKFADDDALKNQKAAQYGHPYGYSQSEISPAAAALNSITSLAGMRVSFRACL